MSSDFKYTSLENLIHDFDYRTLKTKEALEFIDTYLDENISIAYYDLIKIGKVLIILNGLSYENNSKYMNYIIKYNKNSIHSIYNELFWGWDTHIRDEYHKFDFLFYPTQKNEEIFEITLKFILKKVEEIDEASLVDICENIEITRRLNNYQDRIHKLRDEFLTYEGHARYFLLSLYFYSMIRQNEKHLDESQLLDDIKLIEEYDWDLFWTLYYKVFRYCENKFTEKIINFLFSRCHIYFEKELSIDMYDYFNTISIILMNATSKDNLDTLFKSFIDNVLCNNELIHIQFRDAPFDAQCNNLMKFVIEKYGGYDDPDSYFTGDIPKKEPLILFELFHILLLRNKNYINPIEMIIYLESKLEDFDSYELDNLNYIRKIWILNLYKVIDDKYILHKKILKFFDDFDEEERYDIKEEFYDNYIHTLTTFFSSLDDIDLITDLVNYLFNLTLKVDNEPYKYEMFMALISMLKTLKDDKLNQKFIKHLGKCQFSNETHNLLLEYYKNMEIEN